MRSPRNYGSGLHFHYVSPDTPHSHITQPQYPDHQDITCHPHDISCLGLCTKLTWFLRFLSSELFYPHCKKFWSLSSFTDLKNCCHWPNLGLCNQAAGCITPGKVWGTLSQTECRVLDNPPNCWN
jgi:hypothetical protein